MEVTDRLDFIVEKLLLQYKENLIEIDEVFKKLKDIERRRNENFLKEYLKNQTNLRSN